MLTILDCLAYDNVIEDYPGRNGTKVCPICESHMDLQKFSFQCSKVKENVKICGSYSNIFSENIQTETVETIEKITKFRTEYIEERTLK